MNGWTEFSVSPAHLAGYLIWPDNCHDLMICCQKSVNTLLLIGPVQMIEITANTRVSLPECDSRGEMTPHILAFMLLRVLDGKVKCWCEVLESAGSDARR